MKNEQIKIIIITTSAIIRNGLINLFNDFLYEFSFYESVDDFDNNKLLLNNNKRIVLICESKDILRLNKITHNHINSVFILPITIDKNIHFKNDFGLSIDIFDSKDEVLDILSRAIAKLDSQNLTNTASILSIRETEILACVVKGLSSQQIADVLFISLNTVNTHRKNISQKLGIKTLSGLTAYAIINNIIDIQEANVFNSPENT